MSRNSTSPDGQKQPVVLANSTVQVYSSVVLVGVPTCLQHTGGCRPEDWGCHMSGDMQCHTLCTPSLLDTGVNIQNETLACEYKSHFLKFGYATFTADATKVGPYCQFLTCMYPHVVQTQVAMAKRQCSYTTNSHLFP